MSRVNIYHTIGLMSGTSLDGLDIAYCIFSIDEDVWSFNIKDTITIPYTSTLRKKLGQSTNSSGLDLSLLDIELGRWVGEQTKKFILSNNLSVDLISSHGHTVFHQPDKNLTLQIGSGWEIFKACDTTVINDFRTYDITLGGSGAPLVPIGDQLLFSEFEACLNLGGIANISFQRNKTRMAYDIVPVNIVLNNLAEQLGKPFDKNGELARKGNTNYNLLQKLNKLPYYGNEAPKSLGYEWVERHIFPLLILHDISTEDQLATMIEHVAIQLSKNLPSGKTLITGGGTYNKFLIERLNHLIRKNQSLFIPNDTIVEFKEAMIFAFLGVLRLRNDINCLKSVTGASKDSSSGVIYSK